MPLIKTEAINRSAAVALWKTEETIEELKELLDLSLERTEEFERILHEGKQKDWLAGRLAMRYLADFCGISYNGLSKDENGKPYLNNHPFHISLSNSYKYVACIIHKSNPVGIDIEYIKYKIRDIKHKFLSQQELDEVQGNVKAITEYWCGKEVLYKINGRRGMTFSSDFWIEKVGPDELVGHIKTDELDASYPIRIEKIDNHILAYNME